MTDLLSPEDTGEIPMIDTLGTEATRDLREHRRDTTNEHTRNLMPEMAGLPPRRRPGIDQTAEVKLIDVPLGLTHPRDLEGPQKPPPPLPKPRPAVPPKTLLTVAGEQDVADWERIVETDRLSILGSLTATVDGEMVPLPRPIPPTVPVPPAPPKPSEYRGRHRLTLAGRWRRLRPEVRGFVQLAVVVGLIVAGMWQVMG